MDELLSPSEAAARLGTSKEAVVRWFNLGMFPNAFKISKAIRIPFSDIEAAKEQPWLNGEAS